MFAYYYNNAGVAELADALDSKSSGLRPVSVRPRPPAYFFTFLLQFLSFLVIFLLKLVKTFVSSLYKDGGLIFMINYFKS